MQHSMPGVALHHHHHPYFLFFFCDNYEKEKDLQKIAIWPHFSLSISFCPFTANNSLSFRLGILYVSLCPRFSFSRLDR